MPLTITLKLHGGGKMKKALILVLVFLCIAIIGGCSQKKVATGPIEIGQKRDIKKDSEIYTLIGDKTATKPDPITSIDLTKETITERDLAKVQPSELRPSAKELQTRIRDIYFDFDSYDLTNSAKETLREVASILLKNKSINLIIEGHCDERGTNEYNLALGERRANAAKEYLISLGVPKSRIETISYGEEKPVCHEQTEECWMKNRRAHFVFIEVTK